ncbi:hypothetical protein [Thermoanaerobacterium sp. DL9XJH110]|uniref:hypothetical protein n=1 Tax=Thermoanaerobacterium sp. DL9XJH110 TaxID=3386643 RepID=UPI003BB7E525
MWPTMSNYIVKKVLSIFLTGIAIKLMDDHVDQDIDSMLNKSSLAAIIGNGIVTYVLFVFSLGCVFDVKTSASLFLASFTLGMANNVTAKMPSGLYGYQESIIGLVFGLFMLGSSDMLSSLFVMAVIQLLDDYLDFSKDIVSKKNWAFILGKMECLILAAMFFLASIYFDYVKALASIIFMPIIVYIINILSIRTLKLKKMQGKVWKHVA